MTTDLLGAIAEIVMGQSPSGETCNEAGKGLPLLNGPTEFGAHHPTPLQFTTDPRKRAMAGDILFCVRGSTTGRMNWADREYAIGRGIAAIRHRQGREYQHFLRGLIDFKLSELLAQATGSTFPNVSYDQLVGLVCRIPSEGEQIKISRMLQVLDNKIELNRQIGNTLEALGETIFKHWFIDFEFPNEEGKPFKSSGGEMVYSEELEQEIPKGWEVRNFSEIIEVNPRRELPKGEVAKKVSMADLKPWQSWIESWTLDEYHSGQKFRNSDILFARITPSLEHGKTAIVSILDDNETGFGSSEFIVFGRKVMSSELYIFHLCRSEEIRGAAIAAMAGTSGRQRVPDTLFDSLSIVVPPLRLIEKFEKIVSVQFEKIATNAEEVRTLSEMRDSLVPKLMSGKIRVAAEAR